MTSHSIIPPIEGRCLCGAVHMRATPTARHLDACHCVMCRQWGGGPFLSFPAGTALDIDGAEHVVRYPSSAWAERGFCGRCGTHLFYYYKPEGTYACPAGFFADPGDMALTSEIFVDEQPAYYSFAESTVRKTAAQVMAQIAEDKGGPAP